MKRREWPEDTTSDIGGRRGRSRRSRRRARNLLREWMASSSGSRNQGQLDRCRAPQSMQRSTGEHEEGSGRLGEGAGVRDKSAAAERWSQGSAVTVPPPLFNRGRLGCFAWSCRIRQPGHPSTRAGARRAQAQLRSAGTLQRRDAPYQVLHA